MIPISWRAGNPELSSGRAGRWRRFSISVHKHSARLCIRFHVCKLHPADCVLDTKGVHAAFQRWLDREVHLAANDNCLILQWRHFSSAVPKRPHKIAYGLLAISTPLVAILQRRTFTSGFFVGQAAGVRVVLASESSSQQRCLYL